MKSQGLQLLVLGVVVSLLAGCIVGSKIELKDPTKELRESVKIFSELSMDRAPLESVALVAPLQELRAEDGSFVLTAEPTKNIPYYSNDVGPMQTRYLREDGWRHKYAKTKTVRVVVEGYTEPLYGRLAIFPPVKGSKENRVAERFNERIMVTPESLTQMQNEGVGFSCVIYHQYMQDWCDWALWISQAPIPE